MHLEVPAKQEGRAGKSQGLCLGDEEGGWHGHSLPSVLAPVRTRVSCLTPGLRPSVTSAHACARSALTTAGLARVPPCASRTHVCSASRSTPQGRRCRRRAPHPDVLRPFQGETELTKSLSVGSAGGSSLFFSICSCLPLSKPKLDASAFVF